MDSTRVGSGVVSGADSTRVGSGVESVVPEMGSDSPGVEMGLETELSIEEMGSAVDSTRMGSGVELLEIGLGADSNCMGSEVGLSSGKMDSGTDWSGVERVLGTDSLNVEMGSGAAQSSGVTPDALVVPVSLFGLVNPLVSISMISSPLCRSFSSASHLCLIRVDMSDLDRKVKGAGLLV